MTESTPPSHPTESLPERIGPYRVLERLGEGGMGVVYLAEQREPVRRRVALKVIKLGMDSKEVLARFEAERQAVSLMEHENVARIFDAGATDAGQPWFAMERVKGLPITDYCDQGRLTIRERIELFIQVCAGVQHAHQKGVMHRDLKPSNILVSDAGGLTVPKIIDFGLAKATDQRLTEATLFTEQGRILGTPTYMSPEQAGVTSQDVDSRSDIYSLAALLYELLTGELPFAQEELQEAGFLGMVKMIRETEPPKPSTRLTTLGASAVEIARRRQVDEQILRKRLRGDLDWIVMRGLEKDRARRYQTANELAADLTRHLRFEPVSAGPPSARYRIGRFVRRNRLQVWAAALILVALAAGITGIGWFAVEADQRRSEFDQLAGVVHLKAAIEHEKALYPPWPENIAGMEAWLREDYGRLAAMRPQLEHTLTSLQQRDVKSDSERFLFNTLEELRTGVEQLEADQRRSVERRLQWAQRIDQLTRNHPNARTTWAKANASLRAADGERASTLYREQPIDLQPQMGLVPIGKNPATGLWEFYDLRSSRPLAEGSDPAALQIPVHRDDGSIPIGDDTGLIFVLVPGGTFTMGAVREGDATTNIDRYATPDDAPCHRIELAPFLLSRYEMTQGQWQRLSDGETPSGYGVGETYSGIGKVGWTQPVEQVSWNQCTQLLRRHGMDLPTEAQWEYACRAGTKSIWWTGNEASSLKDACNVLDQTTLRLYPEWGKAEGGFDDGFAGPAPVGRYRANPFGFHGFHGNVMEWCRDHWGPYRYEARSGDGLRTIPDHDGSYMIRDCSYQSPAKRARVAARERNSPTVSFSLLGVRPSRPLR